MTSLGSQDGTCFRQREGFAWTLAAAREGPGSMNYAYEIRQQVEAAPRAALPVVTSALWKAFGEGHLSEAEAEALAAVIDARQAKSTTVVDLPSSAPRQLGETMRRAVGSRPRTDASMERRRRWAASGRLPPGLAARFTLAEQAVLALVAAETVRRKDCRLAVGHLAAITGVAETTVRNAIREAKKLGLLSVEERRLTGFRNDTNVVRIVSAEWTAWLRLARKGGLPILGEPPLPATSEKGGGCKSPKRTPTDVSYPVNSGPWNRQKSCRQAAGDLADRAPPRIRETGRIGRAMR